MDPVSNADRLVRVLRQRLEERAKVEGAARSAPATEVRQRGPDHVRAVAGQFARAGLDDEQMRRSLVELLLADQFDPAIVNEVKFQQIVDRVAEAMASDPEVLDLLTKTASELRQ